MKVMAGFRKDQEYFVPRSKLPFPDWTNLEDILQRLFPNINQWRAEYSSALGDDSKAAANFLNELLTYLAISETASRHRLTGQQEENLKAAADIMDAAQNKRSMGVYLNYLKEGDPNVKARKKT